jgi:glutamate-5-semialdehyde dehydrogenase
MALADSTALRDYCTDVARRAQQASVDLAQVSTLTKNRWLRASAAALRVSIDEIVTENLKDIEAAPSFGLSDAAIDRLRLTPQTIESMAAALEQVASLDDPVGESIETVVRPNGLKIEKIRVPLGVVFFIYESRPNVTVDAAAICVKSGNAVILRGGKEARHSNRVLADLLARTAAEHAIPVDAVQLVSTTDREAVGEFLRLDRYVNVAIPRGGEGLIRRVAAEARMPVIKHFDGNCHVYVDAAADMDMAESILINAKCHRMGVCNAAESLLVHALAAAEFLPRAAARLAERGVEIRGCETTREYVPQSKPATEADYAAEFLGPIISVKVVESLDEAVRHVNRYGSHHTDAIVTADAAAAREFAARVDSAAVMINASTRFNDGGEFGLGAEIGISTDKFHARGPCGLRELTSYKYVVHGTGHIRK